MLTKPNPLKESVSMIPSANGIPDVITAVYGPRDVPPVVSTASFACIMCMCALFPCTGHAVDSGVMFQQFLCQIKPLLPAPKGGENSYLRV